MFSLVPTPPAASHPPAPRVARRGRIRISNSDSQLDSQRYCYLSKYLLRGAPRGTLADALELEWTLSSDGLHSLSVPGVSRDGLSFLWPVFNYLPSHKYPGTTCSEPSGGMGVVKTMWASPYLLLLRENLYPDSSLSFLGICAVDSRTNSTPPSDLLGDLLINSWDVSAKNGRSDGLLTVTVKAGEGEVQIVCGHATSSIDSQPSQRDTISKVEQCLSLVLKDD